MIDILPDRPSVIGPQAQFEAMDVLLIFVYIIFSESLVFVFLEILSSRSDRSPCHFLFYSIGQPTSEFSWGA